MAPYYVLVIGSGRSRKPHATLESAREEAHRLYMKVEKQFPVAILETLEVAPALVDPETMARVIAANHSPERYQKRGT